MNNVMLCLMGPTASGKTDLACFLHEHFNVEIISVDSAMIYRDMNIGTAKPDAACLARAPHHLLDVRTPLESYSAADFCADALRLCQDIWQRGRMPLLVGGSMMYFHALQQGLSVLPPADPDLRAELLAQAQQHGWDFLYEKLCLVDPISAQKIHPHDTQRLQRALEVYQITGQPLSLLLKKDDRTQSFRFFNMLLMPASRAHLHERIAQRFQQMLEQGFVQEVEHLLQAWPLTLDHPALRCVGYRQAYNYLHQTCDYASFCAQAVAATRQLAKRQLTWLRHWPDGHVLVSDEPALQSHLLSLLNTQDFTLF